MAPCTLPTSPLGHTVTLPLDTVCFSLTSLALSKNAHIFAHTLDEMSPQMKPRKRIWWSETLASGTLLVSFRRCDTYPTTTCSEGWGLCSRTSHSKSPWLIYALWEAETGRSRGQDETSLANMVKPHLYQKYKINQAQWNTPVIPPIQEAEAGESLESRRHPQAMPHAPPLGGPTSLKSSYRPHHRLDSTLTCQCLEFLKGHQVPILGPPVSDTEPGTICSFQLTLSICLLQGVSSQVHNCHHSLPYFHVTYNTLPWFWDTTRFLSLVSCLKKTFRRRAQRLTPVIPALWEAKNSGKSLQTCSEVRSDRRNYSGWKNILVFLQLTGIGKHFGRPRWTDHLRSGVGYQPGQHGETLAGHGCGYL
ncbi:hypothetical protein AAY473_004064 [Plecturocebus cupreus]